MMVTDDLKVISDKLDAISNKFDGMLELLKMLVRQRSPNKMEKLKQRAMEVGIINSRQVETFLNISRPYALTLMERLQESFPGFRYSVGRPEKNKSSVLIFIEGKFIRDCLSWIKVELKICKKLPLHAIMDKFDLPLQTANYLAELFCKENPAYCVFENKIMSIEDAELIRKGFNNT